MNKPITRLRYGLVFILASAFFANLSWAKDYKVSRSELTFLATGKPGFIRINGEKGEVAGQLSITEQQTTATFKAPLDKFETGIDLRDKHMKETYLETPKYPEATLTVEALPYKIGQSSFEGEFSGTLNLHGQQKPVRGDIAISYLKDSDTVQMEASFPIKIDDFGIDIPSYAGIKVADTVKVTAKIVANGVSK